jgi:hypothetical protein
LVLDKNGFHYHVLLLDFGQLFASAFDLVKSARVGIAAMDQ